MLRVVGRKVQHTIHIGKEARVGTGVARCDVLYDVRPCRGSVALPQFGAVLYIISDKEEQIVHSSELERTPASAGGNMVDHLRACEGAVAPPKFRAPDI